MRIVKLLILSAFVCISLSGAVQAQTCGDASGDASVNILDIVTILEYIAGNPNPINLPNADCDGVTGVTMGDAVALIGNFFRSEALDCTVGGSYSFASAPNDTVYLPIMPGIPAEVNEVYLLVAGNFSSVTKGLYVPILENGSGANNMFTLSTVYGANYTLGNGILTEPNKRVLVSAEFNVPDVLVGSKNLHLLRYTRTSPGVGIISPEAYDRPSPWDISISRDNDLYKPELSYYLVDFGAPSLQVSNHDLHFHALTDQISLDTFLVDFSYNSMNVGFHLYSPSSWISFDQTTGVTPSTVTFTADAAGLGTFEYYGEIYVSYDGFSPLVDTINITLTVHPAGNPAFPAGDVNCDQALNILDLTHMVDFFFRGGLRPFPCE
jgi:hypothetical protein